MSVTLIYKESNLLAVSCAFSVRYLKPLNYQNFVNSISFVVQQRKKIGSTSRRISNRDRLLDIIPEKLINSENDENIHGNLLINMINAVQH